MKCTYVSMFAVALLLLGCGGAKKEKDPEYTGRLVTMEDVDDSLAQLVEGERVRVTYGPDDAIMGAEKPTVTIVEFSDFQCPFCGKFAQTLEELAKAYPQDVRVVFKQFPLPMHPDAELGAKAAIAAGEQGYFWAMHDRLFAHRHEMKRDDLIGHAKELGLDVAKFEADLDSDATAERLEREKREGRRLGVRGTPAFFVNGRSMAGAVDGAALEALVEEERELAKKLMEAGAAREELYAHISRAAMPAGSRPAAKRAVEAKVEAEGEAQPDAPKPENDAAAGGDEADQPSDEPSKAAEAPAAPQPS